MKNKVLKTLVLFLFAVLGIFSIQTVRAAGKSVNLQVKAQTEQINHGDSVRFEVNFGGPGTKVEKNQTVNISFIGDYAKINLPKESLILKDSNDDAILGRVEFSDNKAILIFNEEASHRDDIVGGFFFDARGIYNGDVKSSGKGSIRVEYENKYRIININYNAGGSRTDSVYAKSGVLDDFDSTGRIVNWYFNFNAALNPIKDEDVEFMTTDNLPQTMTWDIEAVKKDPYVVQIRGGYLGTVFSKNGGWIDIEEATKLGIEIIFSGQKLTIKIPKWTNYNGLIPYVKPLNQTSISVKLTAKITEKTMRDQTIEYVENDSIPKIEGIEWNLDKNQFGAKVRIQRSGSWILGVRPGDLKVLKFERDKSKAIPKVKFRLIREDNHEIEAKMGKESYQNLGRFYDFETGEDGSVTLKGLKDGIYLLKEIGNNLVDLSKPIVWDNLSLREKIELNQEQPYKVIISSTQQPNGIVLKVENELKSEKVDIKVTKKWEDYQDKFKKRPDHILLDLEANGEKVEGHTSKIVTKGMDDKWSYTFKDLPKYNDRGEKISYKVVEVQVNEYETPIIEEISPYNFTITNKYINKETTELSGKKIWENDRANQRPEQIQVQLLQNGQKMPNKIQEIKANDWTYKFKDLPKYDETGKEYKYSVEEVTVPDGYKVSYLGNDIYNTRETEFIFENNNFSLEFGNSEVKGQSGSKVITEDTLTSFKGRKLWKNDAATDRPEAIQVQLYADGVAVEGQTKYVSGSGDEWSFEFKNLKKHGESGKEIVYSVKEVTVPAGYDVTYSDNDIINTKREVIIQQGPILGLEETLPTEEHQSGDTTTIEDTRPIDTMSGLSGETGQSGNTTIEEDSTTHVKFSKRDINGKELAGAMIELRNLSGQTIQSWISDGTVKVFYLMPGTYQFVETAAPEGYELAAPITFTIDEKGQIWVDSTLIVGDDPIVMIDNDKPITEASQSIDFEETLPTEQGQSGSTTEVEDTKGPEVIIGGQGEIVDIEENLPTEQGQSGSTTEVEDTKGPEVIIGGQGEVVDIEESLPTEQGQSGSTTEVEDSKPKLSIHFDNEWPKEDKPQLPAVEKPKTKESLPAAGEAEHVLSTIVGAMILFLVSLWGLLKRKASKA
uniref:Fibronectin binding protein n=1 Tax=Streptococcus dysgalactiae TaxID=1334 RepID=Q53971_STRDY|nr:fibronectin binding protein [Streptococcus dysgalactiae]